ncbi:Prolyl oligopeptidase family [Musa troglodytarum]|uniref:Prolyl oligopeptidase family n=1 Tax=Musa troglodytarum TaxID=320322 RepID=A0A9E7JFK9_9LILI|nr:Prolyl oligopeptidase family [Musa troglodytarum]
MVSFLKALVYGAGGVAVVGMVALVAFQERLVYVPVVPGLARAYPFTPARLRLDYEDVFLRTSDGVRLHSWFIKHSPPKPGPTILFFQENAGNIAHRLEFVRIMMQRLQCNVFMLSYRGYGESDGHPSQHGIIMDSQVSSLILENTFTSILDMAGIMFPFLRWFISGSGSKGPKILNCIVRSPWRTIDIIGKVSIHILGKLC